ncbi:HAD family hydrolase [Reinekea sp. G2M2-21]|uniref:HAD family hydrolase n=1 Tax=Reinekea sp. G2M2-21 TaxID=2788942 RepID=UPI0018AA6C55|nr:HAD family hydrolase [Reinekea sp. G2M2-21]
MLTAIIFDLDNTLTHRLRSIEHFSQYFFQRYQLQLLERNSQRIFDIIRETDNGGYGRPENPHPKQKMSIAIRLQRELDWRVTPDVDEVLHCWLTHFPKCSVEMPRAGSVLRDLKRQGYRLAVVSNGAEFSRHATLVELGFMPTLDAVISSDAQGCKKPDIAIFDAVLRALNCAPDKSVYVGDHPINDIHGARDAGMHTVWLRGFHAWPASISAPQQSIDQLAQLPDIIPLLCS